ncbi:Protein transport protein SEC7 [Nakaseomyces bracarensis]|uniref:Protein transport protein SEC7 n=1 Tax=Nakaseomyces bracarensis TaxID=273131 RepID=A0ABR4NT11_9SACH
MSQEQIDDVPLSDSSHEQIEEHMETTSVEVKEETPVEQPKDEEEDKDVGEAQTKDDTNVDLAPAKVTVTEGTNAAAEKGEMDNGDVEDNGNDNEKENKNENKNDNENENENDSAIGEAEEISEDVVHTEANANANANGNADGDSTHLNATPKHIRNISTVSQTSSNVNVKSSSPLSKTILDTILQERDLKKYPNVQKSIERALDRLKETSSTEAIDSILVFEALRGCCRTASSRVQSKALDGLSKLFSFHALDEGVLVNLPDANATNDQTSEQGEGVNPPPKQKLIDAAIDTIADCFQGESTDERVELQIVRALSGCILVEDAASNCHGASLLKAIRTIYNIFIFSLNASNQGIAQATLTQIVGAVFDKIEVKQIDPSSSTVNIPKIASPVNGAPLTLANLENIDNEVDKKYTANDNLTNGNEAAQGSEDIATTNQELNIKDAFLVFRTMAKICAKTLDAELDMRSHAVRSKLLSLHLIYSMLRDHIDVFMSHTIFLPGKENVTLLESIRQYLCLSLSRNAASPLSAVFETTLEIMWLMIANLRADFKREIPVFLTEIYFPITELKTSTAQQKRYFLHIIQRLCTDPRALIEFYLNYDCDPGMPNITEMLVDYLSKLAVSRVDITQTQRSYYEEQLSKPLATYNFDQFPLLTTSTLSSGPDPSLAPLPFPLDYALKMTSLNCVVAVLRSLSLWAHKALNGTNALNGRTNGLSAFNRSESNMSISADPRNSVTRAEDGSLSVNDDAESRSQISQQVDYDDPTQFENLKLRKTELSDCVNVFNVKPKKAMPLLLKKGFIKDESPASIAKWLLETDGLDLATVGDYLGEGDEKNIAVMHAFVDEFDFTGLSIVDALRDFLQRFRLPGEGQKIDRFMLKFAERFVDQNPGVFSKADTAYVLSYSLIMLNTDLHSSQIKNKMTLQEFLENNEGIDGGNDLPKEFMVGLFNEIANNEIKLISEQHQAMLQDETTMAAPPTPSAFNFFSSRDLAREAYMQVSKEIASKTELVFKNLSKSKGKNGDVFYAASHVEHVKSIFETLWMSFLAALTPPFKDYDDLETTNKCLEGIKISIRISSIFGIDDARTSFIGALVQFCNLQNLEEIKIKNVNAMIYLLEVALSEGNFFKSSWKDVLLVVSQIERLQLISKGIDRNTVPDVAQARVANPRPSYDSTRSANTSYLFDIWSKKATPMELAQEKHQNQKLSPEISKFISSSQLVVLMDNIFTKSAELSGNAIIDFIKALTEVSLEEIESSQYASTPRMFSLQKMVDVCYYNMDRIKLEWSPVWAVMGRAFNKIATNSNLAVVFFAVDSLRQLSMRFLDIEELSGFEFQHDFLKPFEYTIQNSGNIEVQEMIIACFRNFILTKSSKIKSGWKTILESLQYTAKSTNESIVQKTQNLIGEDIVNTHFESIFVQEDAFAELVGVFREITKNKKFQKQSLHALESLKKITQRIAKICFDSSSDSTLKTLIQGKDIFQDIWFPLLYCFNDTIMTAEDLEVRSRALNYMFDSLVAYGNEFDEAFWENICKKLLFPIFGVLSKHWEVNQFNSHDDLSVWLSTTLIQALRNLIALFTHYFDSLNNLLDGFFDLLISCICQENDTIARIGRSCLQQLILQNVSKFNDKHWEQIGDVFEKLFDLTTANELFEYDPLHQGRRKSSIPELPSHSSSNNGVEDETSIHETVQRAQQEESSEDVGNETMESVKASETRTTNPSIVHSAKSLEDIRPKISIKNSIVVKCVLQLLMIELLSELFENEEFEHHIPFKQYIQITKLLEKSYEFSRDFNADYGLRTRLVEARVVDKIPNLLKQETSAAAVLIDIMFKLYLNDDDKNEELAHRLISICTGVVQGYIKLDDRTMERSIISWRPVIVEILQGYYEFDDDDFKKFCASMYEFIIQILDKSVPTELRHAIKLFLGRVGELYLNTN